MFPGVDSGRGMFGLIFAAFAVGACRGKGSPTATTVVTESVTPFFAASVVSAIQTPSAPTPADTFAGEGEALFGSLGSYSHSMTFSSGGGEGAQGSYLIQPDGKMTTDIAPASLPGAVNPEEDFLFQADSYSGDGRVGVTLAASAVNFPANALPDFNGAYDFIGLRFVYEGGPGFDLKKAARSVLGTMTIVQTLDLSGSFFVDGIDSAGNAVLLQGDFLLDPNDLGLAFYPDGLPNEVWIGSFAPSGLLVLSDSTLGNGDAGAYAVIFKSAFPGPGPLGFDGSYRFTRIRLLADAVTAFGASVEGGVRLFSASGVFSDLCDSPLPCSGAGSAPYLLNADGTVVMHDPFLKGPVDGSVTSDLGAFVAVETGASAGALPHEAALVVGVRLLP